MYIAVPYGNHGCHGGNMYDAFLYVIANDGVAKDSAYPFLGKVCLWVNTLTQLLIALDFAMSV